MRKLSQQLSILFIILFSYTLFENVYAEEPILITFSPNIDEIFFDGKWTDAYEWKQSSYNKLIFENDTKVHLRSAHQGNFIYLQVNFESDSHIDPGMDSAMVCFDTKNDKTVIPQSDDYCFLTILDTKKSYTFQGNNTLSPNDFIKIPNDENFIAIGTASDKFDRYSKSPHASYEFKIPLDVLGRSDNYGFSISVYDEYKQNQYSWPSSIIKQNSFSFSSPSQWGNLVSPDKSLPEFHSSIILYFIIPSFVIFAIITKFNLFKLPIINN